MRICGITVSVDYADLLSRSLPAWTALDDLIVVTTPRDEDTIALCRKTPGVLMYATDAFYRNGAVFGKASAMNDAIETTRFLDGADWILMLDADVIPPSDWRAQVELACLEPGFLYGAHRFDESGNSIFDRYPVGYFMLFHATDPNAQRKPLFTEWQNASGYDTEFEMRWRGKQKWLDLPLTHIGETKANWCGRGNSAAMAAMEAERRRRRGHEHERIA